MAYFHFLEKPGLFPNFGNKLQPQKWYSWPGGLRLDKDLLNLVNCIQGEMLSAVWLRS